jgi:hypothetical protein
MSAPDETPSAAPRGNGCVLAILMAVGIGLLLPGVCGLAFLVGMSGELFNDPGIALLIFSSIAVGVGGVVLLGRARRMAGYPERRGDA